MSEIKALVDEMQRTWSEYKSIIDRYGTESAEIKERLEKLDNRLDELETKLQRPPAPSAPAEATPETKAFLEWVKKGVMSPEAVKLLSTDVGPSGGFLVPAPIHDRIVEKVLEISPIRQLAFVVRLGRGDTYEYLIEDQLVDAGWTSERATRTETTIENLFKVGRFAVEEMYAEPKITQKLLDDADFDVEGWLVRKISDRFAKKEGEAFVTGDGVGKPRGLLSHPDVTVVKTGQNGSVTADSLIDLVEALPDDFERGARFLMKKATRAAIRKLKDPVTGQYLWQPGLGGEPGNLLGYPVTIVPDMPTIANGSYPVIFGDIAEAYTIVDKPGIAMIRDVLTQKGFVILYTTRRVGGDVVNPQAIVKLQASAS